MGEVLDGLSLWDEHKPQSGDDWVKVAERFIADGCTTEDSSPLFAGLVQAVREAERLRDALKEINGWPKAFEAHELRRIARETLLNER